MTNRPGKRRPASWCAIAIGIGVLIADQMPPPLPVWLGVTALSGLIAATGAVTRRAPGTTALFLALLLVAAGGFRYHQHTRLLPPQHIVHAGVYGERGVLVGRIRGEPAHGETRQRLILDAESWNPDDGEPRPLVGRVWVTLRDFSTAADAGDRIGLQTRLTRPPTARNPGAFDFRRFLYLKGIHATASAYRPQQLVGVTPLPAVWWREQIVTPMRRILRTTLQAHLSGPPAGLVCAMLLGDKHRIPEDVAAQFRHTGLAHALVISGLHVGLVALFFFTGFRVIGVPPVAAHLGTTMVLVVFAFVTDLQAPVVRSAIMVGIVLVGRAIGRRGDVYNSLGLAAIVILTLWPTSLMTLSFQLSFGATLAIVGLHGPLMSLLPRGWHDEDRALGKWVLAPIGVTVAAQLGTGPLIAYHFQQLAPVSLVANVAVVPLLGLAVSLGLLTVLTGFWWPLAGTVFSGANYLVLTALMETVRWFSGLPYASLTTPRPSAVTLVFAAVAVVLLARSRWRAETARRDRIALLLVVLAWGNAIVWPLVLRSRALEITFLDVGQGDGAVLRFPNGRTMVIDGGLRSQRIDAGERILGPFLRRHGLFRIDVVVASHPHSDHIGGLVHLLETAQVGHFVDSGQAYDSWTSGRLRELIADKQIAYHRVAAGDSLVGLGGVGAVILHPTSDYVDDGGRSIHGLNDGSVVVRFDYAGTRILFTGDIEAASEPALLRWGERLRAEVLKTAHHGSRTSSGAAFVSGVDPEICVVSVGAFNKFRHPAPEVMARFRERGARLYRTDGCGAVTLRIESTGARQAAATVTETCAY
jgi:competence protein ComEC